MIYIVGFLAQLLFSARLLLQWIMSEKAKKVVSPSIFWKLTYFSVASVAAMRRMASRRLSSEVA